MTRLLLTTVTAVFCAVPALGAAEPTCNTFASIYKDGTELCTKMWDGAFDVVDDDMGVSRFNDVGAKKSVLVALTVPPPHPPMRSTPPHDMPHTRVEVLVPTFRLPRLQSMCARSQNDLVI